jgi:hypothetical protein
MGASVKRTDGHFAQLGLTAERRFVHAQLRILYVIYFSKEKKCIHRLTAGCKGCVGGKIRKRRPCTIVHPDGLLGAACLRKSFVKSGESQGGRGAFNSHFF